MTHNTAAMLRVVAEIAGRIADAQYDRMDWIERMFTP